MHGADSMRPPSRKEPPPDQSALFQQPTGPGESVFEKRPLPILPVFAKESRKRGGERGQTLPGHAKCAVAGPAAFRRDSGPPARATSLINGPTPLPGSSSSPLGYEMMTAGGQTTWDGQARRSTTRWSAARKGAREWLFNCAITSSPHQRKRSGRLGSLGLVDGPNALRIELMLFGIGRRDHRTGRLEHGDVRQGRKRRSTGAAFFLASSSQ